METAFTAALYPHHVLTSKILQIILCIILKSTMSQDSNNLRLRQPGASEPLSNGDTKSSPSRSFASGYEHNLQDYPSASLGAPSHGTKTFEVHHRGGHFNLLVHDQDKRPLYYVTNSIWTRGVPDVVVSVGSQKGGPVVAGARFAKRSLSSTIHLALGDPEDEMRVQWEEMSRVKGHWTHSLYSFQISLGDERRTFFWKRTRASRDGVKGVERISHMHYKLLEEGSEEVLAMYLDSSLSRWERRGKIKIFSDLGKDWETWVLISALSLLERNRRR